jgi:hypothetical protein
MTSIIVAVINGIALIIVTLVIQRFGRRLDNIDGNVLRIELSVNSMKDDLVAATAKASLAEGKAEGRANAEREASESR